MMDVVLLSSDQTRIILEPLLRSKGWNICDNASIVIVERGCNVPDQGFVILFGPGIKDADAEMFALLSLASPKPDVKPYIIGKKDDHLELTDFKRIRYFRADGNDVFAETAVGSLRIEKKLYEIEDECRRKGFVRIGKSTIVNVGWIAEIIPWFSGKILLRLKDRNEEVEVARNYVKPFKEYLGIQK